MKLLSYAFGCSEPIVIIYHVFVNVHVFSSQSELNADVTLTLLEKLVSYGPPHASGLTCVALFLPSFGPSVRLS